MTTSVSPGDRSRPMIITVIGWFFIVSGIVSIVSIIGFIADRPMIEAAWGNLHIDFTAAMITTFVTGVFYGIIGYGILKGHTWGRKLFIIFGLVSVTLGIIFYHAALVMVVPTVIYYGIFIWLLTRDQANEWFEGTYEPPAGEREQRKATAALRSVQTNSSLAKKLLGILFGIVSGFLFAMALFMFGFAPGLSVIVSILFFGIPAVFILIAGVFLWGPGRWAVFSGWTITASGIWAVLSGGSILILMQTKMWNSLASQMQTGNVTITVNSMSAILLAGIFAVILGIGLINHQYKLDDAAVENAMSRRGWEDDG